MKYFLISVMVSFMSLLSANQEIGSIENFEGNVKIKSEGSIKKSRAIAGHSIMSGDLITTSKKARAKIKLKDGSILVLDESSSIHFTSPVQSEQIEGKIYYKITSRDAKNSLKIKTPFAIIGIKGTTFIVNAAKDSSVTLKEGLIGITSIGEQFALYRQKVKAEFESYISTQEAEYEKYKNAQNGYAEVEHTNEFDLKEKHRISFVGKRVNEDSWNEKDDAEFEHFEKFINNMK